MINGPFNFLKFFVSRVLMLYLASFGIVYFFLDHKAAKWDSYGATLSRLQPPYYHLTQYHDRKVPYNRKDLRSYRLFFSQLIKILPDRADGHAMLGYCQYELGETDAAVVSFKKAADTVPAFLWFNYATGYVYFQKKDYPHAIEYLNRAIINSPDMIVKFIGLSKLYLDAIATMPDFQKDFPLRVRAGLKDSYKLLVLAYFHTQQFGPLITTAQTALGQGLDDDGFFLYYLGVGAYHTKHHEASVAILQQSAEKNPGASEIYYYLSLNLEAMGQGSMAVGALEKSRELESSKGAVFSDIRNARLRIL